MKRGVMGRVAITLWLLLGACAREPAGSPEAAYRAFAEALRRGDGRTAYAALTPATKAKIEARSKEVSQASGGLVKDDPALIFFQSGTPPGPIGQVKRVSGDDAVAVLEVAGAQGPQRVKLVHETGRWLVDLSESLERRDAP